MKNYFHLEGITTGFVGWMLTLGLITIAVLLAGYYALVGGWGTTCYHQFLANGGFPFWILTLKVANAKHFFIMLAYIVPVMLYFIPLSVSLHGSLRPKRGMTSAAVETLSNVLILLFGLGCVLAYFYIPLEFFGAPATFGPGGLGLINAIALLGLLPIVAIISTFFYRKTGHVYAGAFINSLFITWYLVASNALFSFGG